MIEPGQSLIAFARRGFDHARTAALGGRVEGRAAYGDELDGVARLHRRHGVAGVDRTHEAVGALDRYDIGYLGDIENRGGARHDILRLGVVRRDHMAVIGREIDQKRRQILGQMMSVGRVIDVDRLGDPGDLRSGLCDSGAILAGDQQMNFTIEFGGEFSGEFGGNRHRMEGGGIEIRIVVIDEHQNGHQRTPASSRSLASSSPASATMIPAWRLAGSTTLSTVSRGVTSTPSSSGVLMSMGFFFAFMMLGSDA